MKPVRARYLGAAAQDAAAVSTVHSAAWPDERIPPDRIAARLEDPNRVTHLMYALSTAGTLGLATAGYVDGFLTVAADGLRRWEVDLLAVHPDFRGQGFAQALIAASLEAAATHGAQAARAFVRPDNAAALSAFQRCGFAVQPGVCTIFVADGTDGTGAQSAADPGGAHWVPVRTLSYDGLWLEGALTAATFAAARACLPADQSAGAALAREQHGLRAAAEGAGYGPTADYMLLWCDLA